MVLPVVDLRARLVEKEAENARLLAEVARLTAEIEHLRRELERLRQTGEEANARIGQLVQEMAKQGDRISELLAIAKRKKRPEKKPPAVTEPPAPPGVTDEQRRAFENRPKPPEPPPPVEKVPKKVRPTGRKRVPEHLPADTGRSTPTCCEHCTSTRLQQKSEIVETKLHVAPHQRRRVTTRVACVCMDCGKRTTGEAPPSPFERSKVSCEWLAWLVMMKFRLAVPLDRIRNYLGAQGLALSMSFLVLQIEHAAELLAAIDGEHWKQLLAGTHLASDGTGFKVQIPELGLHGGFMEVYHWGDTAVFQYEPSKDGDVQASKLANFGGTLLVDAEHRYNATFDAGVTEAGCNAHGRRKMRDAEQVQPVLAAEGGRFIAAWFDLEEEAQLAGLRGPALLSWRQERIAPLVDSYERWMDAVLPTLIPDDPLAKVITYYQNHWDALKRFLVDPALPLDNSASEREFQFFAKLRLNCLFAGGTEGAHRAAVLLGISSTCRRLKVDLEAYLTWVFVRVGTHRRKYNLSAAELTPAAYKRALAS
jgi:DNA-binding protein H-NS